MDKIDKNEILRKAQIQAREGKDEMEVYLDRRGSQLAMVVGFVICAAISVCTGVTHLAIEINNMWFLYWAMASVSSFYKWYRFQTMLDLVVAIVTVAAAALHGGMFLWNLFG